MHDSTTQIVFMKEAILQASKYCNNKEVPVGAIIVSNSGEIIAKSGNRVEKDNVSIWHAEIVVILEAMEKLNQKTLEGYSLYVTLEPCPMCAGAISRARLQNLVFGAFDEKGGAVVNGIRLFESNTCFHKPNISGGVMKKECAELLINFFKSRR